MTDKFAFTSKCLYRSRFCNAISHVILSTRRVVLLLVHGVVLSTCHVMFRAYPIKKRWTGLWTVDLGLRISPKQKNVVKKLLQIILPHHLLKFCRKRNRNNVFVVEHV